MPQGQMRSAVDVAPRLPSLIGYADGVVIAQLPKQVIKTIKALSIVD
jgi:hypothetical protein